MPKLLQINVTLNQGATGRIAENIGIIAKKKGWDVWYVHGARYIQPSSFYSIQVSSLIEEYLHYAKSLFFDGQGLGSSFATKKLINHINEIHPDVVHMHIMHGSYINYKMLFEYLNMTKIQIVWTFHDCWAFTGHCTYFDRVSCTKWKTLCCDCPQIKSYPRSYIDRCNKNYKLKSSLFNKCKKLTIVSVSNWLESLCRESFLKEKKIITIHNGIDLSTFKYDKSSAQELKDKYNLKGKYVVLGVANGFGNRKGLIDIIKISKILPVNYKIILVGVSESDKKVIPNNIICVNRTENVQELVGFYSLANVFINPTYEDNFPTTNIESLACGTPVLTYNTGGSPEAIDDITGSIIPKGDYKILANQIVRFVECPINNISDLCRSRTEKYFDKSICFEKYINLYNELLIKNK